MCDNIKIFLKAQRTLLSNKAGSTGAVVKWWQRRCNEILGHRQEEDGMYGKIPEVRRLQFNRSWGLSWMELQDITAFRQYFIINFHIFVMTKFMTNML